MKKVSEALKKYQEEHHYTYSQTAESLQLTKSSTYAYMNELRNPTLKSLQKIAKSLNRNVATLIDTTNYEELEIQFLDILKKCPEAYQYVLNHPKEEIKSIKERLKNANEI